MRTLGIVFIALAATAFCLAGCRAKKPPSGTVLGRVTLDGQPVTAGVVTLINAGLGAGASGQLDLSGMYRVSGELPVGQYEVMIQPLQAPPPLPSAPGVLPQETSDLPHAEIPPQFQDTKTSGLIATIKPGSNTADLQLKTPMR